MIPDENLIDILTRIVDDIVGQIPTERSTEFNGNVRAETPYLVN